MSQTALTVGTEYTERMMSGTGTESDPWIIGGGDDERNLQNFFDAIYTDSAYIKITKDIDASKSITYREGIDHSITILASKLYADEKVKVSGLIINAQNAFTEGGGVHTFENIQFLSMIHNGVGYVLSFVDNDSGKQLYLYDCDFSVIKNCEGENPDFSNGCIYTDRCTFNYKAVTEGGNTYFNVFNTSGEFKNTMIHYEGLLVAYHVSAYSSFAFIRKANRVGITGSITSTLNRARIFYSDCSDCYFAGVVNATKTAVSIESNGTNCLLCITDKQGDYDSTVSTSATEVTPEQLRDRDYLYGIGFLP